MKHSPDCYDNPRYWNLAFADETHPEADFVRAAADRYSPIPVTQVLDIACGGGRQLLELARRGYQVTGFDLNPASVRFARSLLQRRHLPGHVAVADMSGFQFPQKFDLAHCFVNSFRHLLTDDAVLRHLQCVAAALKPGGLYLLGLHLLPPDALELDCERWTVCHRDTRITTTVRVLQFDRRRRLENVRFSLRVRSPRVDLRLRTDHTLRIYRADQLKRLLSRSGLFQVLDVFDFWYDITEPLRLNDDLGDTVLVLQNSPAV